MHQHDLEHELPSKFGGGKIAGTVHLKPLDEETLEIGYLIKTLPKALRIIPGIKSLIGETKRIPIKRSTARAFLGKLAAAVDEPAPQAGNADA